MSQENLEIVLSQFESTNAPDFAGVVDTWAEDVELILHGGFIACRPAVDRLRDTRPGSRGYPSSP